MFHLGYNVQIYFKSGRYSLLQFSNINVFFKIMHAMLYFNWQDSTFLAWQLKGSTADE